jgi:putative inorganic carbon (HCO3(-)) transporter
MDTLDNLAPNNMESLMAGMDTVSASSQRPVSQRKSMLGAYAALLLFMFIYCARPEDWIPGMSNAPLAKVAAVLALLALLFSIRSIRQRFPQEVIYLTLLVGQMFVGAAFSPVWRGGALEATLTFSKVIILVVVMVIAVNTMRRLRLIIMTQAVSVAAIAAVTMLKGHLVQGRLTGIFEGNYSDPNDLALAFVISIPLCLALLFLTKNWIWKAAWASAILMMTYGILLTGSRGGFLALIVTAVICLWEFAIRGRRKYLLILLPVVGVIFLQSSGEMITSRLKGTLDASGDAASSYESSQQRQGLFWRSLEVTRKYPLFGVGTGNFKALSGNWHVTHNAYTEMSSEGGIPALILYALILWSGFRNIRATKRFANSQRETNLLAKALQASLIGYLTGAFFLSIATGFFGYFLVTYSTALFLIAKEYDARCKQRKSLNQKQAAAETLLSPKGSIDSPSLAW